MALRTAHVLGHTHRQSARNVCVDEVAEWLRRWTANPLGSARVSSNLILVELFFGLQFIVVFFYSKMVPNCNNAVRHLIVKIVFYARADETFVSLTVLRNVGELEDKTKGDTDFI
jgi:hypothetical protein